MTRWTEADLACLQGRMRGAVSRALVLTPERRSAIARLGGQAKAHKYRNQPTEVEGIRFASKKEAAYYLELQFMKASGEIRGFTRQVSLPLASGKRRMVIDFLVIHLDGSHHWIDVKGRTHPTWAVKRDELQHSLGITIETV